MRGVAIRLCVLSAVILPYLWLIDCELHLLLGGFWDEAPARCRPLVPPASEGAADPLLMTPIQIAPEFHSLMPYGALRSITFEIGPLGAKALGLAAYYGSALALYTLGLLDWKKTHSAVLIALGACLATIYVALSATGLFAPDGLVLWVSQQLTAAWFGTLLIIVPLVALATRSNRL